MYLRIYKIETTAVDQLATTPESAQTDPTDTDTADFS